MCLFTTCFHSLSLSALLLYQKADLADSPSLPLKLAISICEPSRHSPEVKCRQQVLLWLRMPSLKMIISLWHCMLKYTYQKLTAQKTGQQVGYKWTVYV